MSDLFMFFLGGTTKGANIEVHDVQFAAVDAAEEAFPQLAERWWGDQEALHIDTYSRVTWVDGYDVSLAPAPAASENKLWFIYMGGYRAGLVDEVHASRLLVADSRDEAKQRAQREVLSDTMLAHRDSMFDVDECILLAEIDGLHVCLTPNPSGNDADQPEFAGYLPIGGNELTGAGVIFRAGVDEVPDY